MYFCDPNNERGPVERGHDEVPILDLRGRTLPPSDSDVQAHPLHRIMLPS